MGIRYYAYAVHPEHAAAAAASPRDFLRSDAIEWELIDEVDTLDLDKAWGLLQRILRSVDDGEPRPGFELVRGQVTMHGYGWEPFYGYVDPAQVRAIAADLESVDECTVMDGLASNRILPDERYLEDVEYTLQYLDAAVAFTKKLASEQRGLVYRIG